MKTKISTLLFLLILLLSLSACMPLQDVAAPQEPVDEEPAAPAIVSSDDVPRITLEEAKASFDSDSALFVDTRSVSSYEREHIAGAIQLSTGQIDSLENQIPKDQLIITYCT